MAPPTLPNTAPIPSPPPSSVKELTNSTSLGSVPPQYAIRNPETTMDIEPIIEEEIPTVDFSLLTEGTPEQRSQVVRHLGKACEEWGCFMVVNHGIPERLMEAMLISLKEFFDQTEEEKGEYTGKHVMDPIRCGTSFNLTVEDVRYWRDYLKVFVHPIFYSPAKPPRFRETSKEYAESTRAMGMELLRGIWESLGLEEDDMTKALDLHSCFQILVCNIYPPCPQPELAIGLPAHSDHGLLTILLQNGVSGLQVKRRGSWVRVEPLPNSFLVNTGDHMEIVSNGRYKSVLHRAEVNSQSTRLSIASVVAPSLDTIVEPASQLVSDEHPMMFRGMRYGEYVEHQQANRLKTKSAMDPVRLHAK
ncbi:protein DMR6-LIKE OXYGENASE 2-like isoform X2 [Phoenix dactylifera]|uniref:Protein DMR6-LIKE OXYGENASE 2-like isoform X2 n=1 Tax=Phoenix dactylifera TaxID=42345 RepID=A0A8B7D373_PHODC|nr:protein DMR6-LIKE OXYGENASE 2-like isoform X2 [Phoenix dactylifera]